MLSNLLLYSSIGSFFLMSLYNFIFFKKLSENKHVNFKALVSYNIYHCISSCVYIVICQATNLPAISLINFISAAVSAAGLLNAFFKYKTAHSRP